MSLDLFEIAEEVVMVDFGYHRSSIDCEKITRRYPDSNYDAVYTYESGHSQVKFFYNSYGDTKRMHFSNGKISEVFRKRIKELGF